MPKFKTIRDLSLAGKRVLIRVDFNVPQDIIGLDSDPEYAFEVVESICANGSTTVMVYSAQSQLDLTIRFMRAGAREFLILPLCAPTLPEPWRGFRSADPPHPTAEEPPESSSSFSAPKAAAASPPSPPTSPSLWLRNLVSEPC